MRNTSISSQGVVIFCSLLGGERGLENRAEMADEVWDVLKMQIKRRFGLMWYLVWAINY